MERGARGARWYVRRALTPVPPLHSMERGPGGEVESARPKNILAKMTGSPYII